MIFFLGNDKRKLEILGVFSVIKRYLTKPNYALKLIILKLNYLIHQQHQPQVVYTTLG